MVLGKKNKRVDTSMEQGDLTDNPFSALGGMVAGEDLPDANTIAEPSKAEILYKVNRSYSIARTRKGGWPVRKANRGAGKVVTLIQQVSGDTKTLLKELQNLENQIGINKIIIMRF